MEVGERHPFFQFLLGFAAVESSIKTWKSKHALNICPKGKGDNHLQTINFVIPFSYIFCLVSPLEQAWICLLHPWSLIEKSGWHPKYPCMKARDCRLDGKYRCLRMCNVSFWVRVTTRILFHFEWSILTPIKLVLPLLLGGIIPKYSK